MNHPATAPEIDVSRIRDDFPILGQKIRGKRLAYLDNGATTQKPELVIRALDRYYRETNSNVHRAVHALSERATVEYEQAREKLRAFINASSLHEVIFTAGTTESINLVAASFLRPRLNKGDEILVSALEHHSNIVPWQLACAESGAHLRVIPVNDEGEINLDDVRELLTERTRLLAITHVSNAIGTEMPIAALTALAHERDVPVLVDGAQAIAHLPVDVQSLDVDFYAFSGHKMFGPTGIGVLYGREALLEAMPPWQGGGDMIETVTFEGSTWNELPYKFEAGTPNIADAIGLGAAVDYIESIGRDAIHRHESHMTEALIDGLDSIDGLRRVGNPARRGAVVSFVMPNAHAHDIGTLLDQEGIAIRAGHHCAMPAMQRFGVSATARASLACYNDLTDIQQLVDGLHKVNQLLGAGP